MGFEDLRDQERIGTREAYAPADRAPGAFDDICSAHAQFEELLKELEDALERVLTPVQLETAVGAPGTELHDTGESSLRSEAVRMQHTGRRLAKLIQRIDL